jgi:hypothetical protein
LRAHGIDRVGQQQPAMPAGLAVTQVSLTI